MFETSQGLLGQEILFFAKHKNVLWVSFIAIQHKQISFDVAPMYKVHLSDTLVKSWYCMYKVCIYDIPQ